jgi:hypothetical protein
MNPTVDNISIEALAATVHAVNGRLAAAMGDEVPIWTTEIRDQAEHAIRGEVYRAPDGRWTPIDLDHVDWDGIESDNPDMLAMVMRRFHMLWPLMSGYRATRDERYVQAARRYIAAFLRDEPAGPGWSPGPRDGDTQYDIRVGAWLKALGEFRASPAFDTAFMGRMIEALQGNLRYLADHVRPDRNIRILHGKTLLLSGLRLEMLPGADAWRTQGLAILNDAVRRQIMPDGSHMEATPGYHEVIMKDIRELWGLARGMPDIGLRVPTERVAKMADYLLEATRPDGIVISLHDSRYSPEPGQEAPPRDVRTAIRQKAGLPDALPPACAAFPDAGQAFLRDDWTAQSAYLTFDAAPRRSYHWHPCRNSVTLFAHGRALLVDPGYPFETSSFPRYGHRTEHHNTVNFNGWNQGTSPAGFRMATTGGYALVEGLYGGGYWKGGGHGHGEGLFGEHHRMLLWVRHRFGVILDHVHHTGGEGRKPDIESCWQFAGGPVACDPASRRVFTCHPGGNLLMAFPVTLPGSVFSLHEGERDPMRGWLPTDWGLRCIPAPLLRVTAPAVDPWNGDMATLLIPYPGAQPPGLAMAGDAPDTAPDTRRAGYIRIQAADGSADLLVWTRRLAHAIERQHGICTDASLVHLRCDPVGVVTGGLLVDGTGCEYEGRDMTGRLTRMDRLETGENGIGDAGRTGGTKEAVRP